MIYRFCIMMLFAVLIAKLVNLSILIYQGKMADKGLQQCLIRKTMQPYIANDVCAHSRRARY